MFERIRHKPCEVIRQALVIEGLVEINGNWPGYVGNHPDSPDNLVCVYDDDGRIDGREHVTGETLEHYGIQIKCRATDTSTSFGKLKRICEFADSIHRFTVNLSANEYLIQALTRTSPIIDIGPENQDKHRWIHTVNFLVALTRNEGT